MWKKLRSTAMRNSKAMNVEPPKTLVEDERNPPVRPPSDADSFDSTLAALGAMNVGGGNGDSNRNGLYGEGSELDFDPESQEGRQQGQGNGEVSVTEYEDAPLHDDSQDIPYTESVSCALSSPCERSADLDCPCTTCCRSSTRTQVEDR